jgi:hypothetical protein
MRMAWEDSQSRQAFEHELINRKTTWLLTTQGLLFAAYGVTFGDSVGSDAMGEFRTVVAWTGTLLSLTSLLGVSALINSKHISWRDYQGYFDKRPAFVPRTAWPGDKVPFGVRTGNTWLALLPEVLYPLVFVGAWFFLLT